MSHGTTDGPYTLRGRMKGSKCAMDWQLAPDLLIFLGEGAMLELESLLVGFELFLKGLGHISKRFVLSLLPKKNSVGFSFPPEFMFFSSS